MLSEYEMYHGAVIRSIVQEMPGSVKIALDDQTGRANSYVLNDTVALHLKHSLKRLAPWQFTFTMDQVEELIYLRNKYQFLFLGLICWRDGVVLITPIQFLELIDTADKSQHWIRVARGKRQMYSVSGANSTLEHKLSRGVSVLADLLR
jgi:hypothetical protein